MLSNKNILNKYINNINKSNNKDPKVEPGDVKAVLDCNAPDISAVCAVGTCCVPNGEIGSII